MRAAAAMIALALMAAGCARDVHVRFPDSDREPTGSIAILLTQAAKDVTVSVNGRLVANRKHTSNVRIDGVPVGVAEVIIAAGGGNSRVERQVRVAVEEHQVTTIPVGSPAQQMSNSMFMAFMSMVAYVAGRAVYAAFL